MANILNAFVNIVKNYDINIQNFSNGNNRANNMGDGLEEYIKNIFLDNAFSALNTQNKLQKLEQIFSYKGNKNNPPDLILKNGDAIEIKKIESKNSAIALNSSYPKSKLYANSPMITKACKECEKWDEKDILYAIGYVNSKKLKSLWFVYGDCYCADFQIYEQIKATISSSIVSVNGLEFTKTNEIGKVKKIDPLGITDLRIRGMWHIENPNKVFQYIYEYDNTKEFQLICLMSEDKYNSFSTKDKNKIENLNNNNVSIKSLKIKNPNNPIKLIDAKLITFGV